MPTQDDIVAQKELLQAYRQTLDILLDQQTSFTPRYTPPSVVNGIIDTRRQIATVKQTLRDWGVDVVDRTIDTERPIERIRRKILSIPALPLVVGLIVAVVVGVLGLWLSVVPAKMPEGRFNVAVAEFGQADSQGHIAPTDDSKRISSTLFGTIQQHFAQEPPLGQQPLVWHDSMNILQKRVNIGMIASDSPEVCEGRASDLNADMIVYGTLDAQTSPAQLSLRFCTRSRPASRARDTGNLQELEGVDRLGSPIDVPLPIAENIGDPTVQVRADLLARLIVGLNYELAGGTDFPSSLKRARNEFNEALGSLHHEGIDTPESLKINGGYLVYYFIGRENFLMYQDPTQFDESKAQLLDQARDALQTATNLNPTYARAWSALGSVYFLRAQQNIRAHQAAAADLAQCVDAYRKAISASQASQERSAETEAHLTLAEAYWLQASAFLDQKPADIASAQASLQQAEQWAESGEALIRSDQNRFKGYAAMVRGLIADWRAQILNYSGDYDAARAQFELASGFYQKCIDAGADDPLDLFLKRQLVDNSCSPGKAKIAQVIKKMQQGVAATAVPSASKGEPPATSIAAAPTARPAPASATATPVPPTATAAPPTPTIEPPDANTIPPTAIPDPPTPTFEPPTDIPATPVPTFEPPTAKTIPDDNQEYDDFLDAYEVNTHDPGVGRDNGDGIASVTFQFFGPDGQEVYNHTEMNARYCSFGGGDDGQSCDNWSFSDHNGQWPNGNQAQFGKHKLIITIHATRGGVATNARSFRLLKPRSQDLVAAISPSDGSYGDELAFQVIANDPNAGQNNGDGIENVTFQIIGPDGQEVYKHTESNVLYCAFSGGDNGQPCNVWRFSEHSGQWPSGVPVQSGATYAIRATVKAASGQLTLPDVFFTIQL